MKGINAFSAMSGVDDRFVMASLLPADLPGGVSATAKVRKQEKDNWFTRMTSSGWFAAAVSLVVAFGVLAGIVAAGRMAPQNPSYGPGPSSGFPAGTLQNMPESEHDESDESYDPSEDGSDIPVETSPVINDPSEPQKGSVAVISDGFTVFPKGYCVWASGQQLDENGEMTGFDADGFGAVNQLGAIKNEIPNMSTSGNSFSLSLSDGMTLQNIRVFKIVEIQNDTFEEVDWGVEGEDFSHAPIMYLATLPKNGDYIVVLEIHYENRTSADEYIMGVNEYAFWLTTGSGWDQKAPVRVQAGLQTVYPIGHLLESTYYDAEKQEYVTKQYPGAILESLLFASSSYGLPSLTVDTQTVLNLFTADAYEVKSVKVYEFNGNELSLMKDDDNPFVAPIETDYCGSYVVVITANDGGTGEMHTLEFPFLLFVEDPNDGPAITEGPVEWGTGEIEPPTTTPAVKVHGSLRSAVFPTVRDGYRLWSEEWVDGSMASGMGLGAHGQLADILDEISAYNAVDGVRNSITVTLGNAGDTLIRVSVYDKELNHVTDGQDAPVLSELDAGTYIVVLTVVSVGDYIPEAEANERYCTEYAFVLELYAPEPEPPEPVTEAIP